jgi:hypothetical protein
MTFNPATQVRIAIGGMSFMGPSAPLSLSPEHRGGDRLRYLGHTKPIVAIDDDCFAPGNHLAFEKELDWFLHLAIEFDNGPAGQLQDFPEGELALTETQGHA